MMIIIIIIIVFYLDWSALAAENDLPYPVVSDNPVVVHDGDDEARLSDSVQWDGEYEGFVEDVVQYFLVDGCLLLHFPNVVHRPHFHIEIHRYGRSLDREQNPSWRRVKPELQEDSEDMKRMQSSKDSQLAKESRGTVGFHFDFHDRQNYIESDEGVDRKVGVQTPAAGQ